MAIRSLLAMSPAARCLLVPLYLLRSNAVDEYVSHHRVGAAINRDGQHLSVRRKLPG
jgi:hypothetical protein